MSSLHQTKKKLFRIPHPRVLMMSCRLSLADAVSALAAGEGMMTHVRTLAYFGSFLSALSVMVAHFPFARAWRLQPSLLTCLPYSAVALLLTWRLILCFMVAWQVCFTSHVAARL